MPLRIILFGLDLRKRKHLLEETVVQLFSTFKLSLKTLKN